MGVILDIIPNITVNGGSADLTEVNEKIEANRQVILQLEDEIASLKEELEKVEIEYLD